MSKIQKHLLWKQYVAWYCNSYIVVLISNYISNPVFQELLLKLNYFVTKSDEKICIAFRDSLGFTNDIEKPSNGNDSKLNVTIVLRNPTAKKNEA